MTASAIAGPVMPLGCPTAFDLRRARAVVRCTSLERPARARSPWQRTLPEHLRRTSARVLPAGAKETLEAARNGNGDRARVSRGLPGHLDQAQSSRCIEEPPVLRRAELPPARRALPGYARPGRDTFGSEPCAADGKMVNPGAAA